jgi:hypothetical protein
MDLTKCDVCGVTDDAKPVRNSWPLEPWEWRSITVRKAKDWEPRMVHVSGNMVRDPDDAWPGLRRWQPPIVPLPDVVLHFCGPECLEDGVRRLHKGCQLIAWNGVTLPVHVFAVAKIAATQEP